MTAPRALWKYEKAIGIPAVKWPGRCYEIACAVVRSGIVAGDPVYGHWLGECDPGSPFTPGPFIQHGWVLLKDGRILDPTRWVFEGADPYIYIGENDGNYDEGGNGFRTAMQGGPPDCDPDEKRFKITHDMLGSAAWTHIERMLGLDRHYDVLEPGEVTLSQLIWLANAHYNRLEPHAAEVYSMLEALNLVGFVPIDNQVRAERESKEVAAR